MSAAGNLRARAAVLAALHFCLAPGLVAATPGTVLAATPAAADEWLERLLSADRGVAALASAEAVRPGGEARAGRVAALVARLEAEGRRTPPDRRTLTVLRETLGAIGPDARPAVPLLARDLGKADLGASWDPGTRDLLEVLAPIGATPETVGAFVRLLESRDGVVASRATEALGRLGAPSPESVRALLARFRRLRDPYERMGVARALGALGPWDASEKAALARDAASGDPGLAYAAAWVRRTVAPREDPDLTPLFARIPTTIRKASCRVGERRVELVVKSFSADEPDGDFTVWIVDGGRAVPAWFGGRLDGYELLERRPAAASPCDVLAFVDAAGDLVVPVLGDNRPHGNLAGGLVYSPRTRRVAASAIEPDEVSPDSIFERRDDGFAYRDALQPSDSSACALKTDGDCGRFRGARVRERTDEWIGVWWTLGVVPGESGFRKRLDVERTWKDAAVRSAFGPREAFSGAFGLDAAHAYVETRWFAHLVLENGERWVCAAPGREPASDETRCRREGTVGRP